MRPRSSRRVPRAPAFVLLAVAALLLGGRCASFDEFLDEVGARRGLDEHTIVAGLIEALEVGSRNSAARGSAVDGFFGNALIRIGLPQELSEVDRRLRQIGLSRQMDDFTLRMNRAAEAAAGEATDVLLRAVQAMSFEDARAILAGPDDAATRYFERTTRRELSQRFEPIVVQAMDQTGLAQLSRFVIDRYNRLPLVEPAEFDIDAYVVDATLDGLFVLIAEEELAIRTDPAARVTDLLRRVFAEQ